MKDAKEKPDVRSAESLEPQAKKGAWIWPALAGLLIALLLLAVGLILLRPAVDTTEAVPIKPLNFQTENLTALEQEIAQLRDALTLEPCDMPKLPGSGTPFVAPSSSNGSEGAAASPAASPDNLVDRVERATVMVVVESEEGLGNGSGFFIASDLVLTNRHVIDSLVGTADKVYVTNKALGGLVPARVIRTTSRDELRDYALLSVELPAGSGHSVLTLTNQCKRTDRVSAWGYPILFTATDPKLMALMEGDDHAVPEVVYSEGVVSVIQDYNGVTLINHTAEVSPGNSGGPLINSQGQVVGVNTMIRVDPESNRQVNIALGGGDILSFSQGLGLAPAAK